jgi:molybdate transport system ATP-binding protein
MLEIRITKRFANAERELLLEAECRCEPGITILFGASGAGKTTLLDCVAGLTCPDAGRIAVGDRVFFDGGVNLPVQRRGVGYVFQDLALFPHLSAEENIGYGLSGKERSKRTDEILESFHIAHLRERRPREISGGERQRVALARALVIDPCVLLLDEPLAALDAPTKGKMIDDLRAWNRAHGIPIIYVTHSREEVFALGERVLVLENGKIVAQGTPHEVMTAPLQESVAQLAGFENIFEAAVTAVLEYRGTMRCRIAGSKVELETPLVRVGTGPVSSARLRVGIRAGDILLATIQPQGLSARNVLPGRVLSLEQRDMIVVARVDCGLEMTVHLTLAARDVLELQPGKEVWLVVKTHSCHVMAGLGEKQFSDLSSQFSDRGEKGALKNR